MQGRKEKFGRQSCRKYHRFSKDEEAVSEVIARILLFSMGVVFMSTISSTWLPGYLEDKEVKHTRDVVFTFVELKRTIDQQMLLSSVNSTISTPIQLGVEGIPLLQIGTTTSQISVHPSKEKFTVQAAEDPLDIFGRSKGALEYTTDNLYAIDQNVFYTGGAIIISQATGASMKAAPHFSVTKGVSTGNITASITLITLSGDATNLAGRSSGIIRTKVLVSQPNQYQWSGGQDLSFNITTEFPSVWEKFFTDVAEDRYANLDAVDYSITTTQISTLVSLVSFRIDAVKDFQANVGIIEVRLSQGSESL